MSTSRGTNNKFVLEQMNGRRSEAACDGVSVDSLEFCTLQNDGSIQKIEQHSGQNIEFCVI